MNVTTKSVDIGGKELHFELGKIAKQADGSVVIRLGDTMVLVTACAEDEPRKGFDFMPLTVDYRENAYAGGRIPGGFFKREGRPTEREILTCRVIDRGLRPLFPDGWRRETQVISWVMSADPNTTSKTRPISTYSGVPGWCGTPTMWLVVMNSPQSQKDAVGATVAR